MKTVREIEVKGESYLIKKEAVHFDLGDLPTPDGKVDNPTLQTETQEKCPPLPTHNQTMVSVQNYVVLTILEESLFCSVQAVPNTFSTTVDTCQYCTNDVIINTVSITTHMRPYFSDILQPISSLCLLEHLNQQLISCKGLTTATTSTE